MAWRLVLSDAWPGDTAADEPELTLFNGLPGDVGISREVWLSRWRLT
jgi:hypothetical protein